MLSRKITYRTMTGAATLLFLILLWLVYVNSISKPLPLTFEKSSKIELLSQATRQSPPLLSWQTEREGRVLRENFENFRGKVLYLNFWASWCEPCKKELPMIHELSKELAEENLEIRLVNLDEGPENLLKAKSMALAQAPKVPSIYSSGTSFLEAFSIQTLPYHLILDLEGKVASRFYGDISDSKKHSQFKDSLKTLLLEGQKP